MVYGLTVMDTCDIIIFRQVAGETPATETRRPIHSFASKIIRFQVQSRCFCYAKHQVHILYCLSAGTF